MADEVEDLKKFSDRLEPIKKMMSGSTVPSLAVTAVEFGGHVVIQNNHAFISEAEYRKGESPGFRSTFKLLYPRLPEAKTPTKIAIIFSEDGMIDGVHHPLHGPAVAATGAAAWEAMTGDAHLPGIAFNRMPYEDAIGRERKPMLGPFVPDKFKADLAMPVMRAWMKGSSYQVISISTSTNHYNDAIKSRTERIDGEKKMDAHFGENAVFIQCAGNYNDMEAGLRHTAYTHHPSTLLVGACQSLPVSFGDGADKKDFQVRHLESYSSFGPDLVWETNPTAATYIASRMPGETQYKVMDGTSFAAPQAASVVGAMLRRFARSPENPAAMLAKEDILLALKQTAQPVHCREIGSSHTTPVSISVGLPLYHVGKNWISEEAGCGSIDIDAAWKHLEAMETSVRDGKSQSLKRQTVQAEVPTLMVAANAKGHYHYPIEMNSPLITDTIILDVKSRGLVNRFGHSGDKLYLANPNGELLQLMPSMDFPHQYLIAKTSGFHGIPLAGKWQLVSTAPVEHASISFVNAMEPGHVNVAVQPDHEARFRNLYRHADLRTLKAADIDVWMFMRNDKNIPTIALHDFSNSVFPENYLELRLMQLASDPKDKEHAIALVNSGYVPFQPHREALLAAIERQDVKSMLAMLVPNDKAKSNLMEYTLDEREKPAIVSMLLDNGYAKARNHISTPYITRLVQEAERDGAWNKERLEVLRSGIASLHKQNISIMQKDFRGKTVVDFAVDRQVKQIVDDALAEEQKKPELKISAIMNQLPQTPAEAFKLLPTMQQAEQAIQSLSKELGIDDIKRRLPFMSAPKGNNNER